jgi:hypothetical protein
VPVHVLMGAHAWKALQCVADLLPHAGAHPGRI